MELYDLDAIKQIAGNKDIQIYITDIKNVKHENSQACLRSKIMFIKIAICDAFGTVISEKEIKTTSLGKRYIHSEKEKEKNKIFFNLSHSFSYGICAVGNCELGCDIQRIRKVPRNLHRYLEPMKYFRGISMDISSMDLRGQTQLWTMYESLGKCLGTGIPIPEEVLGDLVWGQYKMLFVKKGEEYCITVCYGSCNPVKVRNN